jgi:hypothetical protein
MLYILQHDIRQLNYFFDSNLQLDEGVVVVELEHMNIVGHKFVEVVGLVEVQVVHNVVEELEELVEHIVEHQEQEAVVGHMFVEVVVVVVVEVDHMLVLGKFVVVEVVGHILVDKLVVVVVVVVDVEHIQVVGVDRWVLLRLLVRQGLQVVVVGIVVEHHIR